MPEISLLMTSFGFRYFVTFIDEYSQCTWVYLRKDRSDFLSILMFFSMRLKINLGRSLKFLQGILHQSTCPHTPQQNGIVERKNRRIVETARTLLLDANVLVHTIGVMQSSLPVF